MRTSQLIEALVADRSGRALSLRARFVLALGAGSLISAGLFFAAIGPRPDIASAAQTLRFDLKFIDAVTLALPSALLAWRLLRPDGRPGALALAFLAPFLLLGGAVVVELAAVPADLWGTKLIGSNAVHCLTIIPLLSIAPLAALLLVMRQGRRNILESPGRWRAPPPRASRRRCTPRIARTIRRCSSPAGIRWRR